jgi:hypothetical protein
MVDQNLLTTYLCVTGLAVLIQAGIAVGMYIASLKVVSQADKAVAQAQALVTPIRKMVDSLETASRNAAVFSEATSLNVKRFRERIA